MKYDRAAFRKNVLAAMIGAAVVAAPSVGWARCNQEQLKGTWIFTKHWFMDLNISNGWTSCKLRIDANGNIVAGKRCDESVGGPGMTASGGKLTLNRRCQVRGSVILVGEEGDPINLTNVQMEKGNKTIFSGAGQHSDGFSFIVTAVKK